MNLTTLVVLTAIKIAAAVGFIMLAVPMIVWLERKLIADFQARVGPQRVGPFGLLQSFADGIKLVLKEALQPREVDRWLYYAAPVIVMLPAIGVAAVVPFAGDLLVNGVPHPMVIADLPVGFLFVLALTSVSVYGVVLAGWSSNNKYSLLGGLRSAAQMVSYELPMGLCVVGGLMILSHEARQGLLSLSLRQAVDLQAGWLWNWTAFNYKFLFLGLLLAILFYICGLAETNRAPFDLPEAETELVAGYLTEYGGLKWAMFFLGEYAAMLNVASITTTLFFGGWHAPYPDAWLKFSTPINIFGVVIDQPIYMLHGLTWFGIKVFSIIVVYIWIRATLPRLRYDRLMSWSWKRLLPITLGSIFLIAVILTFAFPMKAPAVLLQPVQQGPLGVPQPQDAPIQPGLPPLPGMPGGQAPGGPPAGPGATPGAPAPDMPTFGPDGMLPGEGGGGAPEGPPPAPAAPGVDSPGPASGGGLIQPGSTVPTAPAAPQSAPDRGANP